MLEKPKIWKINDQNIHLSAWDIGDLIRFLGQGGPLE